MTPLNHTHLRVKAEHVLSELLFICIFLFLGGLTALFLIKIFLNLVDILELDGCVCSLLGDLVLLFILFGRLELFYHVPETHLIIRVHFVCALAPDLLLGFLPRHRQKAAIVCIALLLHSALQEGNLGLMGGFRCLGGLEGPSLERGALEPLAGVRLDHDILIYRGDLFRTFPPSYRRSRLFPQLNTVPPAIICASLIKICMVIARYVQILLTLSLIHI